MVLHLGRTLMSWDVAVAVTQFSCVKLARHEFNFASTDAIHLRHVRLSTSTSYTQRQQRWEYSERNRGGKGDMGFFSGRGTEVKWKTAVRQYNCFLECICAVSPLSLSFCLWVFPLVSLSLSFLTSAQIVRHSLSFPPTLSLQSSQFSFSVVSRHGQRSWHFILNYLFSFAFSMCSLLPFSCNAIKAGTVQKGYDELEIYQTIGSSIIGSLSSITGYKQFKVGNKHA